MILTSRGYKIKFLVIKGCFEQHNREEMTKATLQRDDKEDKITKVPWERDDREEKMTKAHSKETNKRTG